jgi:glucosamine--fructose-6-phosphate aminotransferase (isomerizing)
MCGIIGILGNCECFNNVIAGLQQLQNRGYDSAGVCGIKKNEFIVSKYATTPNYDSILRIKNDSNMFDTCTNIIGHTRWATHGPKTDVNSHPHIDYKNRIAVVHNGMIENYYELKKELINKYNIVFKSGTDTEVIANLISVYYDNSIDINGIKHVEDAISMALSRLEGTWALTIVSSDKPDNMYCARHGSPLLIGFGGDFLMVASEQAGFCGMVNNYVSLNNHDITVLRKRDRVINMQNINNYNLVDIVKHQMDITPYPWKHWTIKEINEQYESSVRAISFGGRLHDNGQVRLGGLDKYTKKLKEIDHIILLGCGTSYNAANYSVKYFHDLCDLDTVQVFDGPSFTEHNIPKKGNTALIFLSQSGETKDLYQCIKIGKNKECLLIGVVNVVDSLIAREVDCGCYLNAGREVGVASTKAFTSQIIVLSLIAINIAQVKEIHEKKRIRYVDALRRLPQDIKNTLKTVEEESINVAEYLLTHEHCFVLGKGSFKAVADEGSLKTKEIGYIHSEAYEGNALRHGPYALLVENTPVIFINPYDCNNILMKNTMEEVKSRGAVIILISDGDRCHNSDYFIHVCTNDIFSGILHNIPMQFIAYHLGIKKGIDVDKPRNLAKSVTV